MSKWYRLDNAAKIFPPSKSKKDPKIFRFSVCLKENIDENNEGGGKDEQTDQGN